MTKDDYVAIMKSSAQTIGTTAVAALLIGEMPVLGWPIVRQFLTTLLGMVFSLALNRTEFAAFFIYVDVRVNKQGRALWDAMVANHDAIKSGKDQENAKAVLRDRFRDLARLKS